MHRLAWVLAVAGATVVACASDTEATGSGGHDGGAGSGGQEATGWWCTCNDIPAAAALVGDPPEARCATLCDGLGGVQSLQPQASAVGTAACDAFCATAGVGAHVDEVSLWLCHGHNAPCVYRV